MKILLALIAIPTLLGAALIPVEPASQSANNCQGSVIRVATLVEGEGDEPDTYEYTYGLDCSGSCTGQGDTCEAAPDWDPLPGASGTRFKKCECDGDTSACCSVMIITTDSSGQTATGYMKTGGCSVEGCHAGRCKLDVPEPGESGTVTAGCEAVGAGGEPL